MRLLHTSDWHIGRTFHGHSTIESLEVVLASLVKIVRDKSVDVVLVAGDIFDSATPAARYYDVFTEAILAIRAAGAAVVITSGNHDSATRLGFQSRFTALSGVHVITDPERLQNPIELTDDFGVVAFYGIPYLEPVLVRQKLGDSSLRTQSDVMAHAMNLIRADASTRSARTVVLSHCFVANVAAPDPDHDQIHGLERDISAGGLDIVPLDVLDGIDYVALGHIHGRKRLAEGIRYSGAPLHYSFGEAGKPRGVWIVDLDADGLSKVDWVSLPVPRKLVVLTDTLEQLLDAAEYRANEDDWVSAIITDQSRPLDAMRKLQQRFPGCATLEHRPTVTAQSNATSYRDRIEAKSDPEIVDGFLAHVRNGVGASSAEHAIVAETISGIHASEAQA